MEYPIVMVGWTTTKQILCLSFEELAHRNLIGPPNSFHFPFLPFFPFSMPQNNLLQLLGNMKNMMMNGPAKE
jgi:hypothetical protein